MSTYPLWSEESPDIWRAALERYDAVIAAQGVASLMGHDQWFRTELPQMMAERQPAFVLHEELVRVTEWKMSRGVWRARNLVLVRGNAPDLVESTTRSAFAQVPHPSAPIVTVAGLAGVGPATASAVLSAFAPQHYPFFDEIVAEQVPALGPVAFTMAYYKRYAAALRERADLLGSTWTPSDVERSLWSNAGGKARADVSGTTHKTGGTSDG